MRGFASVLFLFAIACSDSSNAPKTLAGTYRLTAFNGRPLPGVIVEDPFGSLELLSGSLTIGPDTSFSDFFTTRSTGTYTGVAAGGCDGYWTRSADTLLLWEPSVGSCGETGKATWDGNNTLTVIFPRANYLPMTYTR